MADEPEPEPEPEPELEYDHTVEGIMITIGISLAIYVLLLVFVTVTWVIAGWRASSRPRTGDETSVLQNWRRSFFAGNCFSVVTWPIRLVMLSDSTVETLVGRQPMSFLRFEWHLLKITTLCAVLLNGLLLPVNITGGNWEAGANNQTNRTEENSGVGFWQSDRIMYITSASNIRTNDTPRMLAYLGVMIFVSTFSLAHLGPRALQNTVLRRRDRHTALSPRLEQYSVMIRRFPKELDRDALMVALEPLFPNGELVDASVHAGSAFLIFRSNRAACRFIASHSRQAKNWRRCACRWSRGEDTRIDRDKPTNAVGIDWNVNRPEEHHPHGEERMQRWDGAAPKGSGPGSVETGSNNQYLEHGFGFEELDVVEFSSDVVNFLAMQQWRVRWAPPPQDVIWEKIDVHFCGRAIRWSVLSGLMVTFIVVVVVGTAVATKAEELAKVFSDTIRIDSSSFLFLYLSKYLPVLVALTVNAAIIPTLIEVQAESEGHYLVSNISKACLRKQCSFLFLAVILVPALAIQGIYSLSERLLEHLNPEEVIDLLGREALNASGPFFVRYVLQAALIGTSVNMLLIQPEFFRMLDYIFRGGQGKLVWQFPYEYHYAICCCIFCVSVTQGVAFPPLSIVGVLYFSLKIVSDKFVLLFGRATVSSRSLPEDEAIVRTLTSICAAFLGFTTTCFTLVCLGFFAVKEQRDVDWLPVPVLRQLGPISLAAAAVFLLTAAVAVQYWFRKPQSPQTTLPREHPPFSSELNSVHIGNRGRPAYTPPPRSHRPSWADVLRDTVTDALLPAPTLENQIPRPLST